MAQSLTVTAAMLMKLILRFKARERNRESDTFLLEVVYEFIRENEVALLLPASGVELVELVGEQEPLVAIEQDKKPLIAGEGEIVMKLLHLTRYKLSLVF